MTAASKNLSAIKSRLAGPNVGMEAAMLAGEKIIAESRQTATMRRAESWQKVKDEAPESANFIMSLSATFGKPKALLVVIDDEKVVNTYAAADIPATAEEYAKQDLARYEYHRKRVINIDRGYPLEKINPVEGRVITLSAAEYMRLGKDCDQCGFYKHGSCINGDKAVKKAANDTCSKHSWKGFFV